MKHETINYRGYNIETYYDEDAQSPQEWDDTDRFIVYEHRDFHVQVNGFDPFHIFEAMQAKKKLFDGYYFFPVYAYIHSGVALSLGKSTYPFTDKWDTSFKGFAMIKRERGTWTRAQAHKAAQGLIETWNMFLCGDVYGYSSEAGACSGFYGSEGYAHMMTEAKQEIDALIADKVKQHSARVKAYIKNHVPLTARQPLTV